MGFLTTWGALLASQLNDSHPPTQRNMSKNIKKIAICVEKEGSSVYHVLSAHPASTPLKILKFSVYIFSNFPLQWDMGRKH